MHLSSKNMQCNYVIHSQDLISKGDFTNPDESNALSVGVAMIPEDDSDYDE
jgi:hypothetical protein